MGTGKGNNKPSKAELQRRIAIVMDLLAQKYKRSEIYDYIINESDWGVTYATMRMYINRAKGEIAKAIQRSAYQNLGESMLDMRYLYRRALDQGDVKTALAVRKEMNTVLHVGEGGEPVDVTNTESSDIELENMLADVSPSRKRPAE